MRKENGFTLIELIIVIVILGILAVTAAPQFFNFGADARGSIVRGLQGTVSSASDLVYGRAAIAGVEREANTTIELSGGTVPISYGYPNFVAAGSVAGAEAAALRVLNINIDDWDYTYEGGSQTIRFSPVGFNDPVTATTLNSIDRCYVQYVPAANEGERPAITTVTGNC
ncbi:prepilin-type N-terminal cleavage/methylation domain-containing protein [Aliidiomarina sp. Khilg15.8]